ncbi:MAG: hypothetical protein KGJ86_12855 [Chloroflexota bacterium]|nr:hypothetical protein [Chloroflexota bacterium]
MTVRELIVRLQSCTDPDAPVMTYLPGGGCRLFEDSDLRQAAAEVVDPHDGRVTNHPFALILGNTFGSPS